MDRIAKVLNDDFRPRVGMFVGYSDFLSLSIWIRGVDFANERAFPDEISDLYGFKEWLLVQLGGSTTYSWPDIIRKNFGDGDDAVAKFFELFDSFRSDVKQRGLQAISKEHFDWDLKRYRADRP